MNENISLKRILTFFLIAITISNIFRFDLFNFNPEIEQLPTWVSILIKVLLQGSGVIISALIYCILEEYGWRGYLQEELKSLKAWQKYFIIGFMWYLWHLTFLTKATVGGNIFFLSMMIFGSWGIGQVAESTKSIMASACFHLIIQIMMFNPLIRNGINGTEKLIVFGASVVIWYVIIKKWERDSTLSVLEAE